MTAHKIFATVALLAVLGTAQAARILEQPEQGYELKVTQALSRAAAVSAMEREARRFIRVLGVRGLKSPHPLHAE